MFDMASAHERISNAIQVLYDLQMSSHLVDYDQQGEMIIDVLKATEDQLQLYCNEFREHPEESVVDSLIKTATDAASSIQNLISVNEELATMQELFQYTDKLNEAINLFKEIKSALVQEQGKDQKQTIDEQKENVVPPGGPVIQSDAAKLTEPPGVAIIQFHSNDSEDKQHIHFDSSDMGLEEDEHEQEELNSNDSSFVFHSDDSSESSEFDAWRGGEDVVAELQNVTFHDEKAQSDADKVTARDLLSIKQLIKIELTSDVSGLFLANLREKDSRVQQEIIQYLRDKYSNSTKFEVNPDKEKMLSELDDLEIFSSTKNVIQNLARKTIDNAEILNSTASVIATCILSELKDCEKTLDITIPVANQFDRGCMEFRKQIDKYFDLRSKEEKPNLHRLSSIMRMQLAIAELAESKLSNEEKSITLIKLLKHEIGKVKADHKTGLLGFIKVIPSELMRAYNSTIKAFPKEILHQVDLQENARSKKIK